MGCRNTPARSCPSAAGCRWPSRWPAAWCRAGTPWVDLRDALRDHELEFLEDRHAASEQHKNLWRMIEVSVGSLEKDVQERLAELAVFHEDTQVPEAAVTTLWQHTGGLTPRQSRKLMVDFKQRSLVNLLRAAESTGEGVGTLSLHDLIHDYCVRLAPQKCGGPSGLHTRLLDAYQRICPDGWWSGPNDGYFLDHLRDHLALAGRGSGLADLLLELRWLEAKNAAGLAFDLPHDFRKALGALPEDDAQRRKLRLIDQGLRRDLHFIDRHRADYPQALFQCLWNNGWWYDCPAAAAHHGPPSGGWREGGPPCSRPEEDRLATLVESWRVLKERRVPRFTWLESLRPPRFPLGGAEMACLRGHDGTVTSVSLDQSGRRIVSGSKDKTVRVWDAESGVELLCLRGHDHWVGSVSFDQSGRRIVSGSVDKTVRVWDAERGMELLCLRGHDHGSRACRLIKRAGGSSAGRTTRRYGCGTWRAAWSYCACAATMARSLVCRLIARAGGSSAGRGTRRYGCGTR